MKKKYLHLKILLIGNNIQNKLHQADSYLTMARAYSVLKNREKPQEYFKKSRALYTQVYTSSHLTVLKVMLAEAVHYSKVKEEQKANSVLKAIYALLDDLDRENNYRFPLFNLELMQFHFDSAKNSEEKSWIIEQLLPLLDYIRFSYWTSESKLKFQEISKQFVERAIDFLFEEYQQKQEDLWLEKIFQLGQFKMNAVLIEERQRIKNLSNSPKTLHKTALLDSLKQKQELTSRTIYFEEGQQKGR